MIKLQVREILREAKRQGVYLRRMDESCCPRGVIQKSVGVNPTRSYTEEAAAKLGRTYDDLYALECGFERWYGLNPSHFTKGDWYVDMCAKVQSNPYYKVGRRLADKVFGVGQ